MSRVGGFGFYFWKTVQKEWWYIGTGCPEVFRSHGDVALRDMSNTAGGRMVGLGDPKGHFQP